MELIDGMGHRQLQPQGQPRPIVEERMNNEQEEEEDNEDELMCWECVTDENALKIIQDLNCQGLSSSSEGLESEVRSGSGSGSGLGVGSGSGASRSGHTPHERGVLTLVALRRTRALRILFTPTCSGRYLISHHPHPLTPPNLCFPATGITQPPTHTTTTTTTLTLTLTPLLISYLVQEQSRGISMIWVSQMRSSTIWCLLGLNPFIAGVP